MYWVLLDLISVPLRASFTEFYRVLPSFTEFYRVSVIGVFRFHRGLLSNVQRGELKQKDRIFCCKKNEIKKKESKKKRKKKNGKKKRKEKRKKGKGKMGQAKRHDDGKERPSITSSHWSPPQPMGRTLKKTMMMIDASSKRQPSPSWQDPLKLGRNPV